MTKLAVCLSGQYRTFDKTYDSWYKFVFSKYDCDVFLHTWDIIGDRKLVGSTVTEEENLNTIKSTTEELKNKYGFQDVVIEDYKKPLNQFIEKSRNVREVRNTIHENSTYRHNRITHIYSMWYKALKCFELTEKTDTNYDLVIKCRPDIAISDSFNLDDIDENCINLPYYNTGRYPEPHDYYAVGNYKNMKVYNNLYNHIHELESVIDINHVDSSLGLPNVVHFMNGHALLYVYLNHMQLPIKYVTNFCSIVRE